jgi:hypothetical protein
MRSQGFTLGYSRYLPPGGDRNMARWQSKKEFDLATGNVHAIT